MAEVGRRGAHNGGREGVAVGPAHDEPVQHGANGQTKPGPVEEEPGTGGGGGSDAPVVMAAAAAVVIAAVFLLPGK